MKKTMKYIALMAAAGAAVATSVTANAEGSRNLVGITDENGNYSYNAGSRPFLEWKDSEQMGIGRQNIIYVYAKAGEKIYFGSSVAYSRTAAVDLICGNNGLSSQIGADMASYGILEKDIMPAIAVTLPTVEGGMPYEPGSGAIAKPGAALTAEDFRFDNSKDTVYFFGVNAERERYDEMYYTFSATSDLTQDNLYYWDEANQKYSPLTEDMDIPETVYKRTAINTTGKNIRDAAGYIADAVDEMAGPRLTEGGEGYEPLCFTAPVSGTYAFRFLSINGKGNASRVIKDEDKNYTNMNFSEFYTDDDYYYNENGEKTETVGYRNAQQSATVAAWDVTVTDSENNVCDGRVWSDIWMLDMGANSSYGAALNSNLYVLTHDGFEYKIDFNGMDPFGFAFYSNKRGLLLDECSAYSDSEMSEIYKTEAERLSRVQPLYHSFYSMSSMDVGEPPIRIEKDAFGNARTVVLENGTIKQLKSRVLQNLGPVDKNRDSTHKIFINRPNGDAIVAYNGKPAVTNPSEIEKPENIEIKYEGGGSAAAEKNDVAYGTMGIGGEFILKIPKSAFDTVANDPKSFRITLDFSGYDLLNDTTEPVKDGDGWAKITGEQSDYEKNNLVVLSNTIVGDDGIPVGTADGDNYVYRFVWNGKDAYGNDVLPGVYDHNIISSSWEMGSAHFPLLDVESNPNGIKIERLNFNDDTADMVYYNNKAVSPRTNADDATAWYFTGNADNSQYPIAIGDGLNRTAGISSADGVMKYLGTGDHSAIDIWTRYTLNSDEEMSIGVAEPIKAVENIPAYVSFIAEDGKTNVKDFASSHFGFYDGSEFKYIYSNDSSNNGAQITDNNGHSQLFGNTIATCFYASMTGLEGSSANINWNISLPSAGLHPSYIKSAGVPTGIIADEAVLKDSESVKYNKGNIYKINGFAAEGDTKELSLTQGTTITGAGSVICGLVIDDLYAPDASAVVSFGEAADNAVNIGGLGFAADSADGYSEQYRESIGSEEE